MVEACSRFRLASVLAHLDNAGLELSSRATKLGARDFTIHFGWVASLRREDNYLGYRKYRFRDLNSLNSKEGLIGNFFLTIVQI